MSTTPSTSAVDAATSRRSVVNVVVTEALSRMSCRVRRSATGTSASSSRTMRRTAGASVRGGTVARTAKNMLCGPGPASVGWRSGR